MKPDETQQYMVVWTIKKPGTFLDPKFKDHYMITGSLVEAVTKYDKLLKKGNLHIASIVAVVQSTDYGPHPLLMEDLPQ